MGAFVYISYEIASVQAQILQVPRLRFVIGASALLDDVDRSVVPALAKEFDADLIYAGGGGGIVRCTADRASDLEDRLRDRIRDEYHFDVRIRSGGSAVDAMRADESLYAYDPENLQGVPCPLSGRFPVPKGSKESERKTRTMAHPVFEARRQASRSGRRRDGRLGQRVRELLEQTDGVPEDVRQAASRLRFLLNVSPDPEDTDEERQEAVDGQAALGNRNRWATVCMDGNAIGVQHALGLERHESAPDDYHTWLGDFSRSLDACTSGSFAVALGRAIAAWCGDEGIDLSSDEILVPFRPLILGGDDLKLIAHPSYAMTFASDMASEFEIRSGRTASTLIDADRLTISAGIVFSGCSMPLHVTMEYAEALLRNAKKGGREAAECEKSIPAYIDWETLTQSVIDDPERHRARDEQFIDGDNGDTIRLSRRPYSFADLAEAAARLADALTPDEDASETTSDLGGTLDRIAKKIPRSLQSRLRHGLRQSRWDRVAMLAAISKRRRRLYQWLQEEPVLGNGWSLDKATGMQTTTFLDLLTLCQESHRMSMETVHAD